MISCPTNPRVSTPMKTNRMRGVNLLVALLLVASGLVGSGCKSMTSKKARLEEEEEAQALAGQAIAAENRAKVAKQDEAEEALKRKSRQISERNARVERWQEAVAFLQQDDPRAALQVVNGILDDHTEAVTAAELAASAPARVASSPHDPEAAPVATEPPSLAPLPIEPEEMSRILVVKGTALYDLEQLESAIQTYRQAYELDRTFRPTRINLGKLLFREGRFEEALDVWQTELDDGYRGGELMFLVGQALWEVGQQESDPARVEAARLAIREALVSRPSDPEIQRWLARMEFETGRYHEAVRLFEMILESKPLDVYYLEFLANAYAKVGKYDEAIDSLEMIVRVHEPRQNILLTLGDLYANRGLPGTAADRLRSAYGDDVEQAPVEDRLFIATLLVEAERPEESLDWFRSIPEGHPDHVDSLSRLSQVLLRLQRFDEALVALEQVRELRPSNAHAHLVAGDVYLEREELDKAFAAFSTATGYASTRADGHAGMAEVQYSKGNLPAAVSEYKSALQARPDEVRFIQALAQLELEFEVKQAEDSRTEGESQ